MSLLVFTVALRKDSLGCPYRAPLAPHADLAIDSQARSRGAATGPSHLKRLIGQGALGLETSNSGNPRHVNARIVPVPVCD